MEHRWGNRIRTDIPVTLFADPALGASGRLRDISLSGGFVDTRLLPRLLSTLHVVLPSIHMRGRTEIVRAIVVRRVPDGLGVEWLDDDSAVIAALIHAAQPVPGITQVRNETSIAR